jgi:hypothetical protein
MSMESMAPFLMRLPEDANVDEIFSSIAEIKISHSNFRDVCRRNNYMINHKSREGGSIFNFFSSLLLPSSSSAAGGPASTPPRNMNSSSNLLVNLS